MRRVRQVLPTAMKNDELLRVARAQSTIRRWPEAVGKLLADNSHPDRYSRGTLWVAVQGAAWAQELRMMKEKILINLAQISGEPGLFTDVRFGVRPLPDRFYDVEEPADPLADDVSQLSIREIAERRLARWKHEGTD